MLFQYQRNETTVNGVTSVTVARGCIKDGLKTYGDRVCEADDENGVCNEANGVKVQTVDISMMLLIVLPMFMDI